MARRQAGHGALTIASLRARGDVTIGSERIAVERLRAVFDRRPVEGRLAYAYAADDHPARLDAALSASEFDVDGAIAFATNALAGASLDRPGEIALALDFGKATYAGLEARNAKAKLDFDGNGLQIEQMSIGDLNGAAVNASGRIDTSSTSPRGSLAMTIDAQRLEGAARLAGRFLPAAADAMQGLAGRVAKDPVECQARYRTRRRAGHGREGIRRDGIGCKDLGPIAYRRRCRGGARRHLGRRKRRSARAFGGRRHRRRTT